LQERVTQEENRREQAEVYVAEMIVGRQTSSGNGQVDAVKKGDCAEDEKPADEEPTDIACAASHLGSLVQPKNERPIL
jgi:hypothetical protein